MSLDTHQQTTLAIALIRRGMRISIVSHATGIHPRRLRALYREIHGTKPSSGQLPSSSGLMKSWRRQALASVFGVLYRSICDPRVGECVSMDGLIRAYDLYQDQTKHLMAAGGERTSISVTEAWIIARDLATGIVRFRHCRRCGVGYLVPDVAHKPPKCPLCVLKRQDDALRERSADENPPRELPSEANQPDHL